ncbi:FAD-dependent oxidoreductase, partial [Paraburkholderia sp. SIMBA_050]
MPARVAPNLDAVRGSMDFDVIVLGAGIVGVSSALHLQDRGLRVALVDRRAPGEETS